MPAIQNLIRGLKQSHRGPDQYSFNEDSTKQTQIIEAENEEEEMDEKIVAASKKFVNNEYSSRKENESSVPQIKSNISISQNLNNQSNDGSNRKKYINLSNSKREDPNLLNNEKSASEISIRYKKVDNISVERKSISDRISVNKSNNTLQDKNGGLSNFIARNKNPRYSDREILLNKNSSIISKRYNQSKSESKNTSSKLSLPKQLQKLSGNQANLTYADKQSETNSVISQRGGDNLIFLPQASNKFVLKDDFSHKFINGGSSLQKTTAFLNEDNSYNSYVNGPNVYTYNNSSRNKSQVASQNSLNPLQNQQNLVYQNRNNNPQNYSTFAQSYNNQNLIPLIKNNKMTKNKTILLQQTYNNVVGKNNQKTQMVVFQNLANKRKIMMMNEDELEDAVGKRSKSSQDTVIL
ncbi:UNKNOWN [Stylonychia lemnae]|uniref:Uncharacterized protein n=1 Tax=Stylonychia lemnae TaxID=5949 RepID=A0A078APB7_STYLE|nr:UNKNOWN [Stylonychia lemnae]|eukprot:CDW83974.1 UNKNOWN [Stylonychia lemnae]